MVWRLEDPQCNESGKCLWELVPFTRGYGFDMGCGNHKAFPHFTGLDNLRDQHLFGIQTKPDFVVQSCEKLPMFASGAANYVFSSHLLEHIEDYESALREWWRLIKVGGHLCLYLPHKSFYPNQGEKGANPDHKHDFLPIDIIKTMRRIVPPGGFDLLENQERNGGSEYSFFQVYQKLKENVIRYSCDKPKPEKTCAVIRYGAFGDLLMASSVLPGLKAQGYHITLYSVPRGYEVVKHDPHIDHVILQDPDQVPNQALGDFWDYIQKKYDKFVNLSESVEGVFLTTKERTPFRWPHAVRHKLLNVNYLEHAHELAGVPLPPRQKFYANEQEKAWARKERKSIGGNPFILYSLSGSSVHKVWPYLDALLARLLMTYPDCRIALIGDQACKILEGGWEAEDRVLKRSGVWSIREALSMIAESELVIGCETGVLNAAAFEAVPKVITLSHSSKENLTRDWVNTVTLSSKNTPCYPCHKLLYNWDDCLKHEETSTADCQANIGIDEMWNAITPLLKPYLQEAA